MADPIVVTWPDALLLAALTACVWTVLGAAADRIVAEARHRPRRRGPSGPGALRALSRTR